MDMGRIPVIGTPTSPTNYQTITVSQDKRSTNLSGNVNSIDDLNRMKQSGTAVSLGEEQLVRAIDRALKALEGPHTDFQVSIHEKTRTVMIKVMNKETGELIREIPPEKTLDLVVKMMEFAGILVDERV